MKTKLKIILTLTVGLLSIISAFAQKPKPCSLTLQGDKLIGKCEEGIFTNLEINLEKEYGAIDSLTLFNALPKEGLVTLYGQKKAPTRFEITKRSGVPQVILKPDKNTPRVGWYTFDNPIFNNNTINFIIDMDPIVPIQKEDLEVILQTRKLLKDPSKWHQNDDRICDDDIENGKYSFYCALNTASTMVAGEYNHRNAVMQIMRKQIQKRYPPGKKWRHRFKDYNNMPETSFKDIISIINEAETIIRKELEKKSN